MAEPKYRVSFDDLMQPAAPAAPSVQLPSIPPRRFEALRFDDLMPQAPDQPDPAGMPVVEQGTDSWAGPFVNPVKTTPERMEQAWQGLKMFGAASGSLDLSLQDPAGSEMGDVIKLADELKQNPADEGSRLAIRALGGDPDKLLSDDWEVAGGERLRMWNGLRTQRLTTSNIWQESTKRYKELQGSLEAQKANYGDDMEGTSKQFVEDVMTASLDMVPAIVASYLAGPQIGAGIISGQVLGHSMGEGAVTHELTPDQAVLRTVAFTAAEFAPEIMSLKVFTEAGGTVMKKILKAAGAEGLQEMFTEAVQSGIDAGTGIEEMTLGEYLKTIGYSGAVGAATGGTLRTPGAIIEGNTPEQSAPVQQALPSNRPQPTTLRTVQPGETRPVQSAMPQPDLDTEPTFEELMTQGEQPKSSTENPKSSTANGQGLNVDFSDLMPQDQPLPGQTLPAGAPVLQGGGREPDDDVTTANQSIQELLQQANERLADKSGEGTQEAARLMREARELQVTAAQRLMDAGKPVAFQQGEVLTVITPSTKEPGKLQATTFNATGALGDMTMNSMQDLGTIGVPTRAQFLPAAEAEALMQQYGAAEGQYQTDKPRPDPARPIELPRADRRDDTQTSLTGERVVLQNRDRSSPASVEQMRQIASNPDYSRVGFSRDFLSGAPVVEPGADIPANQLGRQDRITTASGRKVPIQYAIVEADQLLPSHDANGNPLPDYATGKDGVSRVIAGNGRAAGLVKAWQSGATGQYLDDMAFDQDFHGIPKDVILGMTSPVLIRIMPQEEITADIADQTNTTGTAALSPAEQARNDARRVDTSAIELDESGEVTRQAAEQFIAAMPQAEKAGLLDGKAPNKAAYDRLSNMIFATAYESDELLRLYAESADPEIRTILNGLKIAAAKMARLKDAGQYDIRGVVVEAAEAAVSAKRAGIKLTDFVKQDDMARDPIVNPLLEMMAENIRSAKRIGEMLSNLADVFYAESVRPDQDMLGDTLKRSPRELLENFYGGQIDDQDAGAAAQQTGSEPDAQRDEGAVDLDRPPSPAADPQPAAGQPAEEVAPPEAFDLSTQAPEDLRNKDEQEASAADAEARAQIDRERELFGLDKPEGNVTGTGQQSEAQQGGLFGGAFTTRGDKKKAEPDTASIDAAAHQAATSPENDLPQPTDAQKEAGNYQKGHITLHGLDISIENPRGSKRSGTDPDGKAWEQELEHHYGYIKRTEGADGEHVDVFIGPNPESTTVFVVDQLDRDGFFDEHKVMLGFNTEAEARKGYLANYEKGWKIGPVTQDTLDGFKAWLENGDNALLYTDDETAITTLYRDDGEAPFEVPEADAWESAVANFPAPAKTTNLTTQAGKDYITPEEAEAIRKEWREEARRMGREEDHSNEVVISLFDVSGEISKPWREAGYDVRQYDIKLGDDLLEFFPMGDIIELNENPDKRVVAVLAQPPCTCFASSGARWWSERHDKKDRAMVNKMFGPSATRYFDRPLDYTKALVDMVDLVVGEVNNGQGADSFLLENPVGRIASQTGLPKPTLVMNPHNFGDPYTKQTQLWGKFNPDLPLANVDPVQGSLMHKLWSNAEKGGGQRSTTPEGFAYAFFMANRTTTTAKKALDQQLANATDDDISAMIDDLMTDETSPTVTPPKTKKTRKPRATAPKAEAVALSEISLTREVNGKPEERTADAWVKGIDTRINGLKQLFACVNKDD